VGSKAGRNKPGDAEKGMGFLLKEQEKRQGIFAR